MSVVIKQVSTRKDMKKWVDFPNKLYKKVDAYVPFLFNDEMDTFNEKKNPAYEYCESKQFLAYKDKKVVGRIGGIINHAANKKWGWNSIRFTRFDFIDDFEVSSALFNAVVDWGKERGFDTIMGPIGFHDMDHEGMLIEGFNELNLSITFYNHPYYVEHMEKLGLYKSVDWVEYQLKVPDTTDPKIEKLSKYMQERNGYKLVMYNDRKALWKDGFEAFKLIDEAFSILYGSVPLTDSVINKVLKDNIPLINLKYICAVKDKDDKKVGFAIMIPTIAKALKKTNGRLLPFGIFRLLKALKGKNDTLEMDFVAVDPEHQRRGMPAIMMDAMLKMCVDNGVKICETGPELEHNTAVQGMWKYFKDVRQHRRRRCWKKEI